MTTDAEDRLRFAIDLARRAGDLGITYFHKLETLTIESKGHQDMVSEADREVAHPVVRVHPVTGRRALFINSIYTTRFEGMTEAESRPLLKFLYTHAIQPEFTCRLRWRTSDLALWDNRCAMHYAVNDYDGSRRLLHRTTIKGERPISTRDKNS